MCSLSDDHDLLPQELHTREILYVGNIFSEHGRGVTVIETLGACLEERYTVHYASGKRSKAARLMHMLVSVFLLRKRVTVVLIDTYSTLSFVYAFAVSQMCRMFGIPYIPILHGGNLPSRLMRSPHISQSVFLYSRINVAPSKYLQREFSKMGYRVNRIPNTISLADCAFKQRDQYQPRLLYVRAFSAIYNSGMAIQALSHLVKRYPNAGLCMVGPDRDGTLGWCKKLTEELGLIERVKFMGQLSKPEWHRLSESYDIFLNTSNFDNMPVSVIEAMALGLPVVSTNPGGMADLIDNKTDGLLVRCGDAKGMAERIVQLLEKPHEARRLAENARKKVEYFDWQNLKKYWFELLG